MNEPLDLTSTDWTEVVALQRAGAATRAVAWSQSATIDEDRVQRIYDRARYLHQTRGLPWRQCAAIAREECAEDPPDPDPHDTFRRLFPEPVTETEKARARRAAHHAAEAMSKALHPLRRAA